MRLLKIFTCILAIPVIGSCQPAHGLYAGFEHFHEFLLGYDYRMSPQASLQGEAHYVIPFNSQAYYLVGSIEDVAIVSSRSFNTKGLRITSGIQCGNKTNRRFVSFRLEYSYTESNLFIIDRGYSGGSSGYEYSEFKDKYHIAGYLMRYGWRFGKRRTFSIYLGAGIRHFFIRRTFSIEGVYGGQHPSTRKEMTSSTEPVFGYGLRYYFQGFIKNKIPATVD